MGNGADTADIQCPGVVASKPAIHSRWLQRWRKTALGTFLPFPCRREGQLLPEADIWPRATQGGGMTATRI